MIGWSLRRPDPKVPMFLVAVLYAQAQSLHWSAHHVAEFAREISGKLAFGDHWQLLHGLAALLLLFGIQVGLVQIH